ncbi:MAG: CoA-binding protein [Calditrichaeota bacterium]|nr:CoA-binding protein [Calditrichota bacterium]
MTLQEKINDFLAQEKIAVAGVTRSRPNEAANTIYRKLKGAGYIVYALNPNTETVEGDACYPDLAHLPEAVDGVVAVTSPQQTEKLVQDCAAAGVRRVWMHRAFGPGSVSAAAVTFCRENHITLIAGACPMMYLAPVDIGHKCIRWFLGVTNKLPD